jgi:hypothetical protein
MFLARPYLALHLALYSRTMRSAVFPGDDQEKRIPGLDPDRVLFVGEIGVAGYGVLLPGMGMPAQTAARLARATGRGCVWETVSGFDMTAERAVKAVRGLAGDIDVAVVSMGIPDVLMVTSPTQWTRHLTAIIDSIRDQAGSHVRVVVTGIPPMDQFQPIPPIAKKLIGAQVTRLNAATAALECTVKNIVWSPFPELTSKRMLIRNRFSFRAMHSLWAEAIAPHLTSAPDEAQADCRQLVLTA